MAAKNFMLTYPANIDSREISEKIRTVFIDSKISKSSLTDSHQEYYVALNKKKNLTSMKKLMIKNFCPIIRPVLTSEKFYHINDNIPNNFLEPLDSFLANPNDEDKIIMENILKTKLENTNIIIHSEYLLSCIYNNTLIELGMRKKWIGLTMFSIDSKIEYLEKKRLKNFRCDTIVIFLDKLVIFEYKYKFGRRTKLGLEALKCIRRKNYSERVYAHLKKYYYNLIKNLNEIIEIGIGYSIKNLEISLDIKYRSYPTRDLSI
jgi:hypothetical protein